MGERTRNPYGLTAQDGEGWMPAVPAGSSDSCCGELGPAGLDDHVVHLARCTPGRNRWEKPEVQARHADRQFSTR